LFREPPILRDSPALGIEEAESVLGRGVPLLCGLAEGGHGGFVHLARRRGRLHIGTGGHGQAHERHQEGQDRALPYQGNVFVRAVRRAGPQTKLHRFYAS
jgi:hypothetical protein